MARSGIEDIRTVQCVLNSTHGKIGRGKTFYMKAFGRTVDEFRELLLMPEAFIIRRWDAEICGRDDGREKSLKDEWLKAKRALTPDEYDRAVAIVRENVFDARLWSAGTPAVRRFLDFYLLRREDIPLATDDEKRDAIARWEVSI